jgi:hypothetical protein
MEYTSISFDESFLTFLTQGKSYGRFLITSVAAVKCRRDNKENIYYLLEEVLACDVFGKENLIYQPAYLYQAIFGDSHCKILRTHYPLQDKDTIWNNSEYFQKVNSCIKRHDHSEKITGWEQIKERVLDNKKITAKIIYEIGECEVTLEFPVKHLNVHETLPQFQIETGPVLMFEKEGDINSSLLAYICFNNFT